MISAQLRSFTVDEYHRLAEVGVLGEDDRVELLDLRMFSFSSKWLTRRT